MNENENNKIVTAFKCDTRELEVLLDCQAASERWIHSVRERLETRSLMLLQQLGFEELQPVEADIWQRYVDLVPPGMHRWYLVHVLAANSATLPAFVRALAMAPSQTPFEEILARAKAQAPTTDSDTDNGEISFSN